MNAKDVMRYGHQTVLRTVEAFPKEGWYTPGACGRWSVKDLVAHFTSFEMVLVEVLAQLLEPGVDTPMLQRFVKRHAEFNDDQVDRRQDMSMEEVLAEYEKAHAQAMQHAAAISAETWDQEGILPWYGDEYDLEDWIVYSFYGHKREHCGQIATFSDRFKA